MAGVLSARDVADLLDGDGTIKLIGDGGFNRYEAAHPALNRERFASCGTAARLEGELRLTRPVVATERVREPKQGGAGLSRKEQGECHGECAGTGQRQASARCSPRIDDGGEIIAAGQFEG